MMNEQMLLIHAQDGEGSFDSRCGAGGIVTMDLERVTCSECRKKVDELLRELERMVKELLAKRGIDADVKVT